MKKRLPLLVASAVAAVGLVGGGITAFAAINTSKAEQSETLTVDDAIYLHWGENVVGAITSLESPVVKTLIVAAPTGNVSTGNVTLALELAKSSGEHKSIAGVHVEISTVEFGPTTEADFTLKEGSLTKNYVNTVSTLKTASVSYYLRFSLDETEYNAAKALDGAIEISGTLTATLSYAA